MDDVALIVHYQAQPGRGDEVAALLAQHTAATRAEPGCLDFVALRGADDPDSFVLYERYSSADAFKAHQASPHFEASRWRGSGRCWPTGGWSTARWWNPRSFRPRALDDGSQGGHRADHARASRGAGGVGGRNRWPVR